MFIPIFVDHVISALNDYALNPLMTGNYQMKVLFETVASQEKGETIAIQSRAHPGQEKFFALLGSPILHAARERTRDCIPVSARLPAATVFQSACNLCQLWFHLRQDSSQCNLLRLYSSQPAISIISGTS